MLFMPRFVGLVMASSSRWIEMARPGLTSVMQGNFTVTLIEGDGIGPEISQSVKNIFAAAKVCSIPSTTRRPYT